VFEITDLHVHFGVIHAIKGISLTVNDGEIVTLIGANGAGKTTTLRTASGLKKATSGTISIDGVDITNKTPRQRVQMGLCQVPEGRRVFPTMTVLENLELGAYLRKRGSDLAADLETVYASFPVLADRRKQLAGTLSGGEQQMLAIGRAIMNRPQTLLLDEPSMGLAPLFVQEIFEIIKRINETGTTILLVEQNAHMALQVADRGYVIETGSIVLSGTAAELAATDDVKRAYLGG
jgi:branched-chain amino acid transport system ATP-binding protein